MSRQERLRLLDGEGRKARTYSKHQELPKVQVFVGQQALIRRRMLVREDFFAEARTILNALIDNHPNSDYVSRAKLCIADSWCSEHAFKQAEAEYRDFVTFFPNRQRLPKCSAESIQSRKTQASKFKMQPAAD